MISGTVATYPHRFAEPPRIERAFTPDDLERKIMYAATDLLSTDETTT